MALGAVTQVKSGVLAPGGARYAIVTLPVTTGSNYTSNGESLPVSSFKGFRDQVYHASVEPVNEASGTVYRFVVDLSTPTAPKLVAVVDDGTSGVPAEASSSADLSSISVRIFAIGR